MLVNDSSPMRDMSLSVGCCVKSLDLAMLPQSCGTVVWQPPACLSCEGVECGPGLCTACFGCIESTGDGAQNAEPHK